MSNKKKTLFLSNWIFLGSFAMWLASALSLHANTPVDRALSKAQMITQTQFIQVFNHTPILINKKIAPSNDLDGYFALIKQQLIPHLSDKISLPSPAMAMRAIFKQSARQRAPPLLGFATNKLLLY